MWVNYEVMGYMNEITKLKNVIVLSDSIIKGRQFNNTDMITFMALEVWLQLSGISLYASCIRLNDLNSIRELQLVDQLFNLSMH